MAASAASASEWTRSMGAPVAKPTRACSVQPARVRPGGLRVRAKAHAKAHAKARAFAGFRRLAERHRASAPAGRCLLAGWPSASCEL